tara:strand:+ start:210 stop:944 length:735 start_codon:yes stop_codon:yes gene_type:complete
MKTIYWSPVINVPDNQEFVSELKYFEPYTVYKDMNAKEFFGYGASICPAIVDETKNTFAAKSPIDFHVAFDYENQKVSSKYDHPVDFMINFVGQPNPENVHQLDHPCFIFYCEDELTMTQLPPYYEQSHFQANCIGLSGTYNISSWIRPVRPAFKFRKGCNTLDIKRGETLCYFKFNTSEKIRLVRFDSAKLFESKTGPVMQCLGYKNLKAKRFVPTPLIECYEAFRKANYKKRIMKYIEENIV